MAFINWNKSEVTAQELYQVHADDYDGLMFDSVTAEDIVSDDDNDAGIVVFDALVIENQLFERKAKVFQNLMSGKSNAVDVASYQVTEPFKRSGTLNRAIIFELDDGQTISVYLHNPDVTEKTVQATDSFVSYKWLLNKRDITILVAPENGKDISPVEVTTRIMKLAGKNSEAFKRANDKRAEKLSEIKGLKKDVKSKEKELADLQRELSYREHMTDAEKAEQTARLGGSVVNPVEVVGAPTGSFGYEYKLPNARKFVKSSASMKVSSDFIENANQYIIGLAKDNNVNSDFIEYRVIDNSNGDVVYTQTGEKSAGETGNWYIDTGDSKTERYDAVGAALESHGWNYNPDTQISKLEYVDTTRAGDLNPSGVFSLEASLDGQMRWLEAHSGFEAINLEHSFDLREAVSLDDLQSLVARFNADVVKWIEQKVVSVAQSDVASVVVEAESKTLADLTDNETYKLILKDSMGGVMYNESDKGKYDITELLGIWNAIPKREQSTANGIVKGLIDFITDGYEFKAVEDGLKDGLEVINAEKEDLSTVDGIARAIQLRFEKTQYLDYKDSIANNNSDGVTMEQVSARIIENLSNPPIAPYIETAQQIFDKDYKQLIHKFVFNMYEQSEVLFKDITGIRIKGLSRKEKTIALLKWGGLDSTQISEYFSSIDAAKQAQADAEKEAKEAELKAKKDEISTKFNGFTSDMSLRDASKAESILSTRFNYQKYGVLTRKEFVEKMVSDGATAVFREVSKYKEKTNRQYNRMLSHEQEEHDQKVKDGGMVKSYSLTLPDSNSYSVITKTEYDYAIYLSGKKDDVKSVEAEPAQQEEVEQSDPHEADRIFLQSVIDGGQKSAMKEPDFSEKMKEAYARVQGDADLLKLANDAITAYMDYMQKVFQNGGVFDGIDDVNENLNKGV